MCDHVTRPVRGRCSLSYPIAVLTSVRSSALTTFMLLGLQRIGAECPRREQCSGRLDSAGLQQRRYEYDAMKPVLYIYRTFFR